MLFISSHRSYLFNVTFLLVTSLNITSVYAAPEAAHSFIEAIRQQEPTQSNRELIFTAPPRGAKDPDSYKPIVKYLQQKLGLKITYKQPNSWSRYNRDLRKGLGDIYFHGPQFAAWQGSNLSYEIIARLPKLQTWVLVAKIGSGLTNIKHLVGRKVCVQGETNFARLTFFDTFENQPARLPLPLKIKGREQGFNFVIKELCSATIVSTAEFNKYTKNYQQTMLRQLQVENPSLTIRDIPAPVQIIHRFKPNPNQAFTLSPRISPQLRRQIKEALLAPEAKEATQNLLRRYAGGEALVATNNREYQAVSQVLNKAPLFGYQFNKSMHDAIDTYNSKN